MINNTAQALISSHLSLVDLKYFSETESRNRFIDFQNSGVIKPDSFYDDNVWKLTDEYSNVGIYFKFDRFRYSNYEKVFGIPLTDFLNYVKAFVVSLLGRNALTSIQSFLLDIRHIINETLEDVCALNIPEHISFPGLCTDFFSLLPYCDENAVTPLLDALDTYAGMNIFHSSKNQRTLADFETYFKFDEIMTQFWTSDLSDEDRLFYYPLYLWWTVTAVIPLRPREFLLTQRDCLSHDKNGYTLTLMRNKLKGGLKNVAYKIADDYFPTTYPIPDTLALEFQKYLTLTEKFDTTELQTLFVTDPHYKKWAQKKHSNSRYLTYVNLTTILRYFYSDIIDKKYGYTVVDNSILELGEHEIRTIHLGDTRHIAIINLMQEGGTPAAAMFLAGHTNESMSAHYGSNVAELIRCKTYRKYRQLVSAERKFSISKTIPELTVGTGVQLSSNGICFSDAYKNGSIDDCLNTIGPEGEIAYCPTCIYYRKSTLSFFGNDDIYRRQINDDCNALEKAIEAVRSNRENNESITQALLQIHSSATSYQAFLLEKYKNR